jgi:DNA-binding MarR family transcriptional regulator
MVQPLPMQAALGGRAIRKPEWLPTLLAVVRAFQSFETVGGAHIQKLGLTPAQFDIVVTLGNTAGMTCRELGERTLITKGTLTGVLDRLEAKGMLIREESPDDRRSYVVKLTRQGQACFEYVFPAQLEYMDQFFGRLSAEDRAGIENGLARFREVLSQAPAPPAA